MNIRIFDVEHGFCSLVTADTNNLMLFDCGHNETTKFFPSDFLRSINCTGVEYFFPLNCDEDHLSGLPRLRAAHATMPIVSLTHNRSITPDVLAALKRGSGPLGPGVQALLGMLNRYTGSLISAPSLGSVTYSVFCNAYPEFQDTNNLSQVVFVHLPGFSIVFPGDLEKAGWRKLLQGESFQRELRRVKIFVASHHGRESGYEPAVFSYCTPELVVISDEAIQYETQETNYGQHARGVRWVDGGVRRVLTTRRDGTIRIDEQSGGYHITTAH